MSSVPFAFKSNKRVLQWAAKDQGRTPLRFVQIDILPSGQALVDIDKLTHAVPQANCTRLFLGAQHLDVPHSLAQLENVLAGREANDDGEGSGAGFHTR